ncbi:hypothetical protein GCM10022225_76580 [Plantactinospora mayteni]|uniref:Thioredoxin domain-containing protein n=1 Tax=Plantactinospora mayteni TaxID=566021 RepID=A0ABQ4F260_9ACTN|nr:TlpA disulfide reductase family protein [Plantactinospora mayteni]GIH01009.1 hypothetical protein Pma05_75810 [Plantactinospora mayteni]
MIARLPPWGPDQITDEGRDGVPRRRPLPRLPGIRRRRLLLALGLGALGVTGAVGMTGTGGTKAPVGSPGTPAPALRGPTLAGEPFDLAELRGRVVLVNVFASWCGPCRDELPMLADAQRRWSERVLRVVGLAVRDSSVAVRDLLDQTGAQDLTVLPDPTGTTAVDWGARGVPETFLVDGHGRIADRVIGPVSAEWLDRRLTPLLDP